MIKKVICLFTVIIGIGVCGCVMTIEKSSDTENVKKSENTSKSESTEKKKYELNERQIEILKSEGLPEDYAELTIIQKRAIKEIEELLEVLEEKYSIGFVYKGYVAQSQIEYATLYAYAENNSVDVVTITKIVNGEEITYKDDYMSVCVRDFYEEYISDYFINILNTDDVKVYSYIAETTFDDVPKQYEKLDGNVSSDNMIFIKNSSCSDEQLSQLLSDFKEWINQHELQSSNQIIRLKEDYFEEVNRYNYTDYLSDEYYTSRDDCNFE